MAFDKNQKWLGLTDVMVDIETTGTMPDRHAVLQIAAVKFNVETGEIDADNMFDQSLLLPPTRSWSESTRDWWMTKPDVLRGILQKGRDPMTVLREFQKWCGDDKFRFWAKPTHFDFTFMSSYFNDFEVGNPFHFRDATDMNSFIRGLYFPHQAPNFEKDIPFQGPAHNALFDTIHQISVLLAAVEGKRNEQKQKAE